MTTTEELYINAYSATTDQWSHTGAVPYLDDSDSNNISSATNGQLDSYWTFPASACSGTINIVKIRLKSYATATDCGTVDVYVWNGAAWICAGSFYPAKDVYTWYELDVSAILTTWAKINGVEVAVQYSQEVTGTVYVNRLTRKVTSSLYTIEASAFNALTGKFRRAFKSHPSFAVTLSSLSFGTRDAVTGWYAKTYTDSTVNMIIVQKETQNAPLPVGYWVRLDALGLTVNTVNPYDLIKDALGRTWEVETVKPIVVGEVINYFVCDLKELPLYG